MSAETDLSFIQSYSFFQGAPQSTYGKQLFDRQIEKYGNITDSTRKQINFHYQNNTDIGTIARGAVTAVVGAKIKLQSRTGNKKIDDSFEDAMDEHLEAENFDITGRWHRDDGWRQLQTSFEIQGGIIIRHHYNPIWKIPYRIEIIGIDKIDVTKNVREEKVINGIKTDKYGRVVGLYLYDDELAYSNTSTLYDMENMDYYISTWASLSQYTAISRFVTILQTIDGMSQYTMAEVKAATERSKNGIFWHTELFSTITEALDTYSKTLPDDQRVKEIESIISDMAASNGVGIRGVKPTPQEDKMTIVENKTATVYDTLSNSSEKRMAASMGTSQVTAFKDIEKGNFSSINMAVSIDDKTAQIKFNDLEYRIIRIYMRRLFEVCVQIGRVELSHKKYFANPRKYHKFDIKRTSKSVMSKKDNATADAKDLESGMILKSKAYAERDGSDYYEDVLNETKLAIQLEEEIDQLWEKSSAQRPQPQEKKESQIIEIDQEEIDKK